MSDDSFHENVTSPVTAEFRASSAPANPVFLRVGDEAQASQRSPTQQFMDSEQNKRSQPGRFDIAWLKQKLREWSVEAGIRQDALTSLLKILCLLPDFHDLLESSY